MTDPKDKRQEYWELRYEDGSFKDHCETKEQFLESFCEGNTYTHWREVLADDYTNQEIIERVEKATAGGN